MPPHREDYDFSTRPEEELWDCYQYEYLREDEELRGAILRFRQENEINSFEKSLTWYIERFQGRKPCFWFIHFSEWPDTPYLRISVSERKRRFKELRDERLPLLEHIDNLKPTLLFDLRLRMRNVPPDKRASAMGEWLVKALTQGRKDSGWPQIRSEETTNVLFQIRWGMTDTQIIEAFRRWLHKYQPEWRRSRQKIISETGAGASNRFLRAALKDLGSNRLLQHFGYREASRNYPQRYTDQAGWTRATTRARKRIEAIRQMKHAEAFLD